MNRGPAAFTLVALLSAPRMVAAEPCAPRAEVDGDAVAVERVTDELGRLGVAVAAATPGCPVVQAIVELGRDGGITVAVRGAARRSEGRVVSDAALAAVWIDSWLRDDLDGWSAPPTRVAVLTPVTPASAPPLAPPGDVAPAAPQPSVFEVAVSLSYERAWTNDGSSWSGGNLAACFRVGPLCVGGRARAAFEPELTSELTAATRSDLSVLATVSLPVDVGQFSIAPELGLGLGRFNTKRLDGCMPQMPPMPPPNCNLMMDPTCVAPPTPCEPSPNPAGVVYVGDGLDESSFTPRLALALRVAVPLFRHVWLDGLASVTLAPFGHRADYEASSMTSDPGPFPLPGEPGTAVQLGVGLRVGAP